MKRMYGMLVFGILIVGSLVYVMLFDSDRSPSSYEKTTISQLEMKVHPESTVEELKDMLAKYDRDVAPQINNEFERKLAERMYVEKKMYEEAVDVEQLLIRAKKQASFDRAWLAHAKGEYGIVVTDEAIDEWIEKGPDSEVIESQSRYAEAKEMSVYELNHDYYRDQYVKWVVWEALIPLVTKRYEASSEQVLDNNRLIELYEQEVENSL
ncbi:hypothetical protein [Exiguobacterium qingdaonense]|uniref:hypothetical protein n=1 Tax=Exiguobacterium qingdaonense TaxID=2751251 RepID=UPI001BEB03AF|nr:hypothetical protein [Exiguobacterium qingdaonense]